jgi:hypothetical protein
MFLIQESAVPALPVHVELVRVMGTARRRLNRRGEIETLIVRAADRTLRSRHESM